MMICIWPDGAWCEQHEAAGYTWRSDDYITREVPDDCVDDVDAWAAKQVSA